MSRITTMTTERPSPLTEAMERACRSIAPSWPLDRQVAVNPFWGLIDQPFTRVATRMRRLLGVRFGLLPQDYRKAFQRGEISASALARALEECGVRAGHGPRTTNLDHETKRPKRLALLSDILDHHTPRADGPRWSDTITQQVSQYCASYFDERQADWHRGRAQGLFAGWRAMLLLDHALEPLMHAPQVRARLGDVPDDPQMALGWALERLGVPAQDYETLLLLCLLRINGWASWCAWLGWEAALAGRSDSASLRDLLAIRTTWEALVDDGRRDAGSNWHKWREQWQQGLEAPDTRGTRRELVWQRAQEISFQDRLIAKVLVAPTDAREALRPAAQLVFCIDVRSERFRRALEGVDPAIETRGFAGFFGLPIRYRPLGAIDTRSLVPALMPACLPATDGTGETGSDHALAWRRTSRLVREEALRPFNRSPSGAFSLVETIGLGFAAALLRRHMGVGPRAIDASGITLREAQRLRPRLDLPGAAGLGVKVDLLSGILRSMSLTAGFARVLVLVGHGSQCENNPQAAMLECGACGGHSGETNARILAGLLNERPVREALGERGIHIPHDTVVLAALHNTTTDEVELFDLDRVPVTHVEEVRHLERNLREAGHRTRAERAPDLGLASFASRRKALLAAVRRRARDWAQTRPEWGLANNAAFIVGPRSRTRGVDLAGRCFLHDYTWADDRDGKVLEGIMTAPMIVTHWINLQYFASTVAPDHFGSGNKVLHNVVGGNIGVFEGNTGDLRIGLARQSVHDGERWMHAPLRLTVLIDAPREMIDRVLARQATVRHLVANEWLHLLRFTDGDVEWYRNGRWQRWSLNGSGVHPVCRRDDGHAAVAGPLASHDFEKQATSVQSNLSSGPAGLAGAAQQRHSP